MLLRRLKDRVVKSEPGKLQTIATSATLGRGEQDFPEVVDFASHLFGEKFEWIDENPDRQDVVQATRVQRSNNINDQYVVDSDLFLKFQNWLRNSVELFDFESIDMICKQYHLPDQVINEAKQNIKNIADDQKLSCFLYFLLNSIIDAFSFALSIQHSFLIVAHLIWKLFDH